MTIHLVVRTNWGYQDTIELPNGANVGDLKRKVAERTGKDASGMQAYYRGRAWDADDGASLAVLQRETHVTLILTPAAAPVPEENEARPVPGREAQVRDIYRPGPDERSVRVSLRTLCNKLITVDVPLDMAIGEIKRRILEPATLVYTGRVTPAVQMVVIFKGRDMADDMTPHGLDLMNASVLHLGRVMDRDALDEVMYEDRMHINCVHCNNPGVQLGIRPSCPKCGTEAVMLTAGELKVGRSTWKDLLNAQVRCFNPDCNYKGTGATNMVCMGKIDEDTYCPSRISRRFDLSFRPAEAPEEGMTLEETRLRQLVMFLNTLFCYPHEGGLECVRPGAAAAAGAAGGGAA